MDQLTRAQLIERYEKINPKLKEAIFSVETADKIDELCREFNIIKEDEIGIFSTCVGRVLLGFISLENFGDILEKELNLEKQLTIELTQKTKDVIFSPLISLLDKGGDQNKLRKETAAIKSVPEKKERPKRSDTYREPIE